jgi:hypothetical protein
MDWNLAIEKNREALKRILATLVAMAALAGGAPTLPRHLHRAVLRLLRPAEAAARRLVIALARGLVMPPRPVPSIPSIARQGPALPNPTPTPPRVRKLSLAVVDPLRMARPKKPVVKDVPRLCVPGFTERFPLLSGFRFRPTTQSMLRALLYGFRRSEGHWTTCRDTPDASRVGGTAAVVARFNASGRSAWAVRRAGAARPPMRSTTS